MRFQLDDKGATSIEYAILGSLIAAVIVLVVTTLGIQVRTLFETVMQGW
jgi:pilus assembly protein Flp/PilA